jgi:hypothetical protein
MLAAALVLGLAAAPSSAAPLLDKRQRAMLEALFKKDPAPQDPLYKGLPEDITRDYPEKEGFVLFEDIPNVDPPVGGGLHISDPSMTLNDVFDDESFADLPDGAVIKRNAVGAKEIWDYPVGTRVMHKLFFKTTPPRLFELRLVKKMPDGKWSFGIYRADDGRGAVSDALPLHKTGTPALFYDLIINGKPVRVDLFRLSPGSCRMCHWMMGHGSYQFPDQEHVGPCAFVPANDNLLGKWAKAFQAKKGWFPFSPAP